MCQRNYTDATIAEMQRIAIEAALLRKLDDLSQITSVNYTFQFGFSVALNEVRNFVKFELFATCDNPPE